MSRWRLVLALFLLLSCGAAPAWTASWHLLAGGSAGVFTLHPESEAAGDDSFTAQATLALELSLWTTPLDARLGFQTNFNQPLQGNAFQERENSLDWGVYAKGKVAFVYAGIGWQRIQRDVRPGRNRTLLTMSGWVPFQMVGMELKLALVSLNLEIQRYRGDLQGRGARVAFRRTLVRVLVGLHF